MAHDKRMLKYHQRGFGCLLVDIESFLKKKGEKILNGKNLAKMILLQYKLEQQINGASYDEAYLPYGPEWDVDKIKEYLHSQKKKEIDKKIKAKEIQSSKEFKPFYIFGTFEEVLEGDASANFFHTKFLPEKLEH